jgi:2-hydroxychromene-2-carboxylate isomerase
VSVRVVHYFDYKSPYAYLAQEATRALSEEFGDAIEWRPYGRDVVGTRTEHQWRRVRYAYADCRREAARRGLVILGPRRIFDSSSAHIGFLWAQERGDFRAFHGSVYERFWRRELDIEDAEAIEALLGETGVDAAGFRDWLGGEGRREHDRVRAQAEATGVFGVPSYVVDGELFFGNERIERVRERLAKPA